jgi:hypothetical protein
MDTNKWLQKILNTAIHKTICKHCGTDSFDELDKPITSADLEFNIKKLKNNKACCMGILINEYFIECYDILSFHLVA